MRFPRQIPVLWCCVVVAAALEAGCGGGGSGSGNTSPAKPWPTATFSGTVRFAQAPLAGVTVIAYDTNNHRVFGTATTDANGGYTFSGLNTACADSCTQNYEFWATKPGFAFAPVLASNPSGSRASYQWDAPPSNWYVPGGVAVTRAGNNDVFANGSGAPNAVFTVFNFMSVTAGSDGPTDSTVGADFAAFDGSSAIVRLAATGQVTSYAPGDDGAQRAGVAWPLPRFVDHGDGSVTDALTGLVWLKDAGCLASADWATALAQAAALASGHCALTDGSQPGDWRVPNQWELESLVDASAANPALPASSPFAGLSTTPYWTSTSYYGGVGGSPSAWAIRLSDGRYINDGVLNAKSAPLAVWAVRGAGGGAISLQATGFYVHYAPGDDGSIEAGVPLPFPRLVDNGDGTVTDAVTGLVWLQQGDCISGTWSATLTAIASLASGQCGLSDGSIAGQWRLPNRKELASLADRAQNNQADFFDWSWSSALPGIGSMSAAFRNVIAFQYYWTSTTDAAAPSAAWTLFSCDFGIYDTPKASVGYALAVRDHGP
ncbi:MAG: DUF1566 domain-containing protein [Proteobacteria bacterium]|nr:DUF1566 domain-containing protein [Pseudomonadota bacterium]